MGAATGTYIGTTTGTLVLRVQLKPHQSIHGYVHCLVIVFMGESGFSTGITCTDGLVTGNADVRATPLPTVLACVASPLSPHALTALLPHAQTHAWSHYHLHGHTRL